MEPINTNSTDMDSSELRKQTLQLNRFPVSPYFKTRVLARIAKANNFSVWEYLQAYTKNSLRGALALIILFIILLVSVPTTYEDQNVNQAATNYYLIQDENPVQDIRTNDQALLFALSN